MALEVTAQQDFSGGMFHSAGPERIPRNGVADLVNGLVDVDGSAFKRGGSTTIATHGNTLAWLWSGQVGVKTLTLVASSGGFASDQAAGGSGISGGTARTTPVG